MRYHSILRTLLAGSALVALSTAAVAQEETKLDLITVIIAKVKQSLEDAVGGVSVATRKDLEQHGSSSVSDILAPMPGVSTEENADDPATAINIRGLQDFGRVAVTIDGARQNFQRSGHNADGMFYFEPEMMKQVTVTRGPVANVYGSGAIGGVVSFETIDALSFLREDENFAGQEKVRYSLNGDGIMSSTILAGRLGEYGGILGNFVYRDIGDYTDGGGDEIHNSGREIVAGLVKGTLTPSDGHLLNVSYLINADEFESGPSTGTRYDNDVQAETLAAKYEWDGGGNPLFNLTAGAYWTETYQEQIRLTGSLPLLGSTRTFDIETIGTDVFNTSRFSTGSIGHTLTLGADVFEDQVEVTDPASTADLFTPAGTRTAGGAFIQDKLALTSWLDVEGALRFDAYKLEGGTASSSGERLSPKATVAIKPFNDTALSGITFYGLYAEGYRAPAITETLISGIHPPPATFDFLPNPDLVPEVAHNFEVGINGAFADVFTADDTLSFRAGAYHNEVSDYIGGVFDPIANEFQYQNIAEVRLWGVEFEAAYDAGWVFAGLSASHGRGDDTTADVPLATIPADKVVSTLGFRFLDEKATVGARWFAVADQHRVPAGSPTSESYDLVNLFASYAANEYLSFGVNADNIFDEEYRTLLDAQNSPGRSIMFTVTGRLGG
jgi:hemoglobin/transferrin/lactoferrin receptor protein